MPAQGEADPVEAGRALLGGPEHAKGVALVREGLAALRKEPASAATLHRIGLAHFYLEEDSEACDAFRKASGLAPKDPEHVFMLAVVLMYRDVPEATLTMARAIELDPEDARFRFEMGRLLAMQERPEEALASYRKACELDPRHAGARLQAGNLCVAKGLPEEALVHYAKAVEVDPRLVDAFYNAAQIHYDHGRFEAALALWEKAAGITPDDFEVRKKLVQAHYALGRPDLAEPHRKRVLELRPEGLKEFCFDQFDAGEHRVFAYETFEKGADLYYHYTFKVATRDGKTVRTVNLESSAVIRELGARYILGSDLEDGSHRNFGITWKELPPYAELKQLVVRAAKGELE